MLTLPPHAHDSLDHHPLTSTRYVHHRPALRLLYCGSCFLQSVSPLLRSVPIRSPWCREPVNSLNLDLWSELLSTLTSLESDARVRGAIFVSTLKRDVYSAGNDINELYAPNTSPARFRQFWTAQTTFLTRLYRSRLFTIAAIRGACPAGGCIISLCCDYRVMCSVGNPTMGLNEVALGISVPRRWVDVYARTVGSVGKAEQLLGTATMVGTEEALKLGLVNRVVDKKEELLPAAESEMLKRLKFPDHGRVTTKLFFREELSRKWESEIDEEIETGWKGLASPGTVASLKAVLERLSPKAKL